MNEVLMVVFGAMLILGAIATVMARDLFDKLDLAWDYRGRDHAVPGRPGPSGCAHRNCADCPPFDDIHPDGDTEEGGWVLNLSLDWH